MQFAATVLVLATAVSASYPVPGNMTYTTEVVSSYETYCAGPTTVTYGTKTYEVTEPTTLTITDCPVTVVTPVYSTSSVICHSCSSAPPAAPVYPTVPVHANTTVATTAPVYHPTGSAPPPAQTYPAVPPTAGAGKMAAGLVGVLAAVAAAL